jgi:hypothetical protein
MRFSRWLVALLACLVAAAAGCRQKDDGQAAAPPPAREPSPPGAAPEPAQTEEPREPSDANQAAGAVSPAIRQAFVRKTSDELQRLSARLAAAQTQAASANDATIDAQLAEQQASLSALRGQLDELGREDGAGNWSSMQEISAAMARLERAVRQIEQRLRALGSAAPSPAPGEPQEPGDADSAGAGEPRAFLPGERSGGSGGPLRRGHAR